MAKNEIINSLEQYLLDISNFNILPLEEENALLYRYRVLKDESAKQLLFESNLKRVYEISLTVTPYGLETLDLIQEGNIALMKFIDRYELGSLHNFDECVKYMIKVAMIKSLADKGKNVHIPFRFNGKSTKISRAIDELKKADGKMPSMNDIKKVTRCTEEDILNFYRFSNNSLSDDGVLANIEDDSVLVDGQLDEVTTNASLKELITVIMDRAVLNEKEMTVLKLRYGLLDGIVHTNVYVADTLNLSHERIRQIIERSFEKIKLTFENDDCIFLDNPSEARRQIEEIKSDIQYNSDGSKRKIRSMTPSIYNFFSDYTKIEIDEMIAKLTDEEKSLMESKYSLDAPKRDILKFYEELVPTMKELLLNPSLREKRVETNEVETFDSEIEEEPIKFLNNIDIFEMGKDVIFDFLDDLSVYDVSILTMKYGYIDDVLRSDEEVSEMLKVSLEEVQESIAKYKDLIIQKINNNMSRIRVTK